MSPELLLASKHAFLKVATATGYLFILWPLLLLSVAGCGLLYNTASNSVRFIAFLKRLVWWIKEIVYDVVYAFSVVFVLFSICMAMLDFINRFL